MAMHHGVPAIIPLDALLIRLVETHVEPGEEV